MADLWQILRDGLVDWLLFNRSRPDSALTRCFMASIWLEYSLYSLYSIVQAGRHSMRPVESITKSSKGRLGHVTSSPDCASQGSRGFYCPFAKQRALSSASDNLLLVALHQQSFLLFPLLVHRFGGEISRSLDARRLVFRDDKAGLAGEDVAGRLRTCRATSRGDGRAVLAMNETRRQ